MKTPLNTHQIFYAKGFYQHSGDVIADMRKVCKLDNPSWDFSSPKQILKFMRKQYEIWLENNPRIQRDKDGDNKVAWDDNPISAEIWHILIAYSCYIPMTNIHGFIKGLPRYDVLKPQYNVNIYRFMDSVFNKSMTVDQLLERAKQILNMPNTEIMDTIADSIMQDFDFERASKVLVCFGENASAEELDDELWTLYSELVGYNMLEDGTIKERSLHSSSKHFSLDICPKFAVNCTMDIDVQLLAKSWEYASDCEVTSENFKDVYLSCCDNVLALAGKDFESISMVCSEQLTDDNENWEAPEHLHSSFKIAHTAKEVLHDYIEHEYFSFGYDEFAGIEEYGCLGLQTGCFASRVYNDNGKMRVVLELHTMYGSGCYEHSLHNVHAFLISSPKY